MLNNKFYMRSKRKSVRWDARKGRLFYLPKGEASKKFLPAREKIFIKKSGNSVHVPCKIGTPVPLHRK